MNNIVNIILKELFESLFPMLIISFLIIIIMLLVIWKCNHFINITISTSIFFLAIIHCIFNKNQSQIEITKLFYINKFSNFYTILILISAISTLICSYIWFKEHYNQIKKIEEYYILLSISTLGGITLTIANHFVSIFIGIELLSLPLFGLIGFIINRKYSIEINIKYLILSVSTSSFFLFGVGLIYIDSGNLNLFDLNNYYLKHTELQPLLIIGIGLILMSIGFKLSFVPFHLWTPDIYQISPTPITMYLSTTTKISVFVILMKLLDTFYITNNLHFITTISIIIILTILIGNLLAISQRNIKRMLSYSSISQIGYLLISLLTLKINSIESHSTIIIYIINYIFTNIGIFLIITKISANINIEDKDNIKNYYGLYFNEPTLTIMLTIMILSLIGIPTTLGFIAKFHILLSIVIYKSWLLAIIIIIGNIISLIYYLNFISILYTNNKTKNKIYIIENNKYLISVKIFSSFCIIILILFGIYPQYLINIIHSYL